MILSRIFLIGYMGSGKTSLGKQLSDLLPSSFLDLDHQIEQESGKSIAALFQQHGEAYFRNIETRLLRQSILYENVVIAVGGGTPCHSANMSWMLNHGIVIYIQENPAKLLERLLPEKEHRPLIARLNRQEMKAYITEQLNERQTYYQQAHHTYSPGDHTLKDLIQWLTSIGYPSP